MQPFPDKNTPTGAAQLAVAATIIDSLTSAYGLSYNAAIGALANAFAESSLRPIVPGDEAAAGGLWQVHTVRRAAILAGCGVDMWSGSVAEQCHGAVWELTQPGNKYLGYAAISSAATPEDAAEGWCRTYERPENMAADVALRRTYATKFAAAFPRPA
jgi:hypothetical protein